LYQHVTDVLFETIIRECVNSATFKSGSGAIDTTALIYEEDNAIYYIGEYVLKKESE